MTDQTIKHQSIWSTSADSTAELQGTSTSTAFSIPSSSGTDKLLSSLQTSAQSSVTMFYLNNSTTDGIPHGKDSSGLHISSEMALGIFLFTLTLIVMVGTFLYLWKKSKLSCKPFKIFMPKRKRRSSTSSQGPLTHDDATFVHVSDPPRQERELFSIGDQDGGDDGRPTPRHRRGTEDDYFYDEIFEKSAFVDETTNRANTHLTVEDEMSELNIPDLVFKKPTTRI